MEKVNEVLICRVCGKPIQEDEDRIAIIDWHRKEYVHSDTCEDQWRQTLQEIYSSL